MITKIISGGQTGADVAALDAAIEPNIPHGGWIPKKLVHYLISTNSRRCPQEATQRGLNRM